MSFKISTTDGSNFRINIKDLEFNTVITSKDLMFDVEDKIRFSFQNKMKELNLLQKLDLYELIEMAEDLWLTKNRFLNPPMQNNRVVNLD